MSVFTKLAIWWLWFFFNRCPQCGRGRLDRRSIVTLCDRKCGYQVLT